MPIGKESRGISKMNWRSIQGKLKDLGHYKGVVDGIRGRMTNNAIISFKRAFNKKHKNYFQSRPYIHAYGPKTHKALFELTAVSLSVQDMYERSDLPWMDIANSKKGLHERHHNRELFAWLRSDGAGVGDPAKIPWCGDFVETCIALALPDEVLPANPYLASNWTKFGNPVSPRYGAILVFWRGSPSSWKGHIGFYVSEDATHYHVLGGNQSNKINVARISKKRLRVGGSRWPGGWDEDGYGSVKSSGDGLVITTDEA